jgi:hypothetical protein
MNVALEVSASKANVARYHSLLAKEWTKRTLEDVLLLLWAEIGESGPVEGLPFGYVLKPETGKAIRRELNQYVVNFVRSFRSFFEYRTIPQMPRPEALSEVRTSRLVAQAETTWTYLNLHILVSLRGETGFFLDTQSLLFLTSVHFLLPALKQSGQEAAHDCLVNALYMHTLTAWAEQPEHFFYLQGVLMDYLGNEKETQESLRRSLELTPPEDDSYLTKVQDYSYALLDADKTEAAWSFLLSVYRKAPQSYLEEVEEMMTQVRRRLPTDSLQEMRSAVHQ